ncbi:MAG: thiosulfate sulfurtransferase [Motiliproteus sp.]|jgi:thiosulfate sulfurtransferase
MTEFQQIDVTQAQLLIEKGATLADVRDEGSFESAHIRGAVHLHNQNLQEFIDAADLDLPLLVYCYHGHSSQSAAQFLLERGFDEAYSLVGGFEAWQQAFPDHCVQG